MSTSGEGFLARWSRRKAGGGAEEPESAAPAYSPRPAAGAAAAPEAAPGSAAIGAAAALAGPGAPSTAAELEPAPAAPAPAPPTLDDVRALTRESDYSRFVARDVDPQVRNAALKKLFSDPHFNVMDGLDTYIDDYGKPDPIPPSMLRAMVQSASLGLFDAEPDAESRDVGGGGSGPSAPGCASPAEASGHPPQSGIREEDDAAPIADANAPAGNAAAGRDAAEGAPTGDEAFPDGVGTRRVPQ